MSVKEVTLVVQASCSNCYFSSTCDRYIKCEYYTPIDEQPLDDANNDDDIIEQNRIEFRKEWFRYVCGWDK